MGIVKNWTNLKALGVAIGAPAASLLGSTVALSGLDGISENTAMGELTSILETVGDNWRGLVILAIICIGPLFWVVREQIALQRSEGAANRDALRELTKSQAETLSNIEKSSREANREIVDEIRKLSLSLARMEGGRRDARE